MKTKEEILDILKKEFKEYYFDRRKIRDGLIVNKSQLVDYGYLNGLELAIELLEEK